MIYYEARDFPADGLVATGEDVEVHVPAGTAWRYSDGEIEEKQND